MAANLPTANQQAAPSSSTRRQFLASQKRRERASKLLVHFVLIAAGALFVFPLLWMFLTALKSDQQLMNGPWFPNPPVWSNFTSALGYIPFGRYTLNTIYICVVVVLGTVVSSVLPAYSFARLKWPGRNVLFFIVLATMMLPYQVTMIPVYIIFRNLNWIGTYKPLTIPAFFGSAFFIFLLRQFFMGIPEELSDAARIDGASEIGILYRVILPLAKPAVATVALFTFMWSWNDFMGPLIYLSDPDTYTLSLGLQQFQTSHGAEWALLMAASTIVVLPILVLFFFTQKTFIEGITVTGMKG